MTAGLAGNADPSLASGHPEHRAAGGAFEEPVEILLTAANGPLAPVILHRLEFPKKPFIFCLTLGSIPAENPEIGVQQTGQRQDPENGAPNAVQEHGDNQKQASENAACHG